MFKGTHLSKVSRTQFIKKIDIMICLSATIFAKAAKVFSAADIYLSVNQGYYSYLQKK